MDTILPKMIDGYERVPDDELQDVWNKVVEIWADYLYSLDEKSRAELCGEIEMDEIPF